MDERAPKPPLADDPIFLANLSELDRGLIDDPVPNAKAQPSTVPTSFPSEPREGLSREAAAALAAAAEALAAFDKPPKAGSATSPTPRNLLDLFPQHRAAASRAPAIAPPSSAPPASVPPATDLVPHRSAAAPAPAPAPRPRSACETFYGLSESPFGLSPDLRFLFHSGSHDRVVQQLTAAVGRRDGLIVLTGEFGIGKTTLCRALVDALGRRTLVSFVTEPFSSAQELLQTMLVDFGVISRADVVSGRLKEASQADLAAKLRVFLASLTGLHAVALLIIDDAQNLPAAMFGELQMLSGTATDQKLLQVVLVGEPELGRLLRNDDRSQQDSRVTLHSELGPLAAEELPGYVTHRLAVAGGPGRAEFSAGALNRVYTLSLGTPRTVNLICDRALTMGHRVSAHVVTEEIVDRAARDLGLLAESGTSASGRPWRQRLLMAVLMLALMLAGAAAAGWTFRGPLQRVLARWHILH